jgi:hypothetical protein
MAYEFCEIEVDLVSSTILWTMETLEGEKIVEKMLLGKQRGLSEMETYLRCKDCRQFTHSQNKAADWNPYDGMRLTQVNKQGWMGEKPGVLAMCGYLVYLAIRNADGYQPPCTECKSLILGGS